MRRPIIVGMCNPHSRDPRDALAPSPIGSAGWRLYQMIHAVGRISADRYLKTFDRRNLCAGSEWRLEEASRTADALMGDVHRRGHEVVILGLEAWGVLRIQRARPLPCGSIDINDSRLYYIPHPSGRNLYYNDEMNRWRVGATLMGLARRYGRCAA